jgi:hypothetical protein
MSLHEVTLEGTLKQDGKLELDQTPNLPQGRVKVIIQAGSPRRPDGGWWQYLQQARRELEAMNYPTMTESEVQSHIEWLRGDNDRIEEVYREMEEQRRREQAGC